MNHQQYFNQYFMSNEDWALYSPIVIKIFDFMNGHVNTVHPCVLRLIQINPAFDKLLGQFNFPNIIDIYLGNIILQYDFLSPDIKALFDYRRHDFICSRIAFGICHELYHADQFIQYDFIDWTGCYFDKTENEVEEMAFQWLESHHKELESLVGFTYIADCTAYFDERNAIPFIYDYQRITLEQLYLDHINYIFGMERYIEYMKNKEIPDFGKYVQDAGSCIVGFSKADSNETESVWIKQNKIYLAESLPMFERLCKKYIEGYYDFNKEWDITYNAKDDILMITLVYSNYEIEPIIAREDMAKAYDEFGGKLENGPA